MSPRYRYEDTEQAEIDALVSASAGTFRRLGRQTQIAIIVLLLVAAIVAVIIYFRSQQISRALGSVGDPNLLLGNPSNAGDSLANPDNYLMVKPFYVLSYNSSLGVPNWVSWRVTDADLGNAPRKQTFDADSTLPPGLKVVTSRDYQGGGFDRGHMCPHSDRAANQEMSFATFVMTNIIPQAPSVNEKAWAQLESYCRELVRQGNHLYIIAGPLGRGGLGSRGFRKELAGGKVAVPAYCWKIAVVVRPEGDNDLASISMGTRVIAVIMPNDDQQVGEEWAGYRTSTTAIEQQTGFHFFDRVRPDIAAALKQKVDDVPIAPPRPLGHGRE